MLRFLLRYLRPEVEVRQATQLREGPAALEGTARAPAEPLRTPYRNIPCIAYAYVAWMVPAKKAGQAMPQKLREAIAHGAFPLELGDGTVVEAVPARPGSPMSREDHLELHSRGLPGFYIEEKCIRWGGPVRVEGMLVRRDGSWVVRYKALSELERRTDPGEARQSPRRRKSRTKAKGKSRR